jgi:nucleotidyltransferase substrate binding protein (TIGR01987 family)
MNTAPDIRWKQRFQNFDRAFLLLRDAMENGPAALNALEREGVTHRFEYCFELAWKTLNDYLDYIGVQVATVGPRPVIKDAFAAKLISDGQVWIDMLDHRNLLSHTYSQKYFESAVQAIHTRYLRALGQAHEFLHAEAMK